MLYHCQEMNWQNQCGLKLKNVNFYRETLLLSFYLFNCTFNNIPLKSSFTLHTKKKKGISFVCSGKYC